MAEENRETPFQRFERRAVSTPRPPSKGPRTVRKSKQKKR